MYEGLAIKSGYWKQMGPYDAISYPNYANHDIFLSGGRYYDPYSNRTWNPSPHFLATDRRCHNSFIEVEDIEDILLEVIDSGSEIAIVDSEMMKNMDDRYIIARLPLYRDLPPIRDKYVIHYGQEINIYISTKMINTKFNQNLISESCMKKFILKLQYLGIYLLDIKEEKRVRTANIFNDSILYAGGDDVKSSWPLCPAPGALYADTYTTSDIMMSCIYQ